jgi:hypothetical protein
MKCWAVPVGVLVIGLAACRAAPAPPITAVRVDSAGITVISIDSIALAAVPEIEVDARPVFDVGGNDQGAGSELLFVNGVRRIPGGTIALANDATKEIRLYDGSGEYLRSIGRRGSGPGEFIHVSLVPSGASGFLAFDALQQRLSRFDAEGRFLDQSSLAGKGLGAITPLWSYPDSMLLLRTHSRLPDPTETGTVRGEEMVALIRLDGTMVRSFGSWHGDEMVLRAKGEGVTGGSPPFPRLLVVAASDSQVVIGDGEAYELRWFDRGGKLRTILRVAVKSPRVTHAMVEGYRERVLGHARGAYEQEEWTRLSTDDVFPDRFPAYDQALVSQEGELWVRDYRIPGATTARWHIFGRDGMPKGQAELPAAFTPTVIDREGLTGIGRDSLDLEHLQRFGFE